MGGKPRAKSTLLGRPEEALSGLALAKAGASEDRAARVMEIAEGAPDWVQLMPAGTVETRPGDSRAPWKLLDLAGVIRASLAGGGELPVDFEHQTQNAPKNGQPAPAAGWIKELQARPDGIYTRVDRTERARAMIEAREYRFLSPIFDFDKKTREVRLIHMAGLTNDRALCVKALATGSDGMEEFLELLRQALGLAEVADQAAICTAATAAVETIDSAAQALTATAKVVAGAEPDPAKFVPIADHNALAERAGKLEGYPACDQ